jgi:hypothetical protein
MAKSRRKSHKETGRSYIRDFIGSWAFVIGIVIAIVLGLLGNLSGIWVIVLIFFGLVIGLLNITKEETTSFLISGTVLVIVSALGGNFFYNVEILANILGTLLVIFVPAVVIVAIRSIFNLAKD